MVEFTTASDIAPRMEAFVRHEVRRFYKLDDPAVAQLVDDMDEASFLQLFYIITMYLDISCRIAIITRGIVNLR